MYDKKQPKNYYSETQRAVRESDHVINEILYAPKSMNIDLTKLEIEEQPRFLCNFMKVFHKRLALYMEGDKCIIIENNEVKRKEVEERKNDIHE